MAMAPRRSSNIYVPVNSIGTSTNRHAVTPEMREAYQNTLVEKEKIIEQIKLVKEELRQGGIDSENLRHREQMIVRKPLEPAIRYNPNKVHPGVESSPRPMPPPMPEKPNTTPDILTAPSPPQPLPTSQKHIKYDEEQILAQTRNKLKVTLLDNETTQTEPTAHDDVVIPENLAVSDAYEPKRASAVPPTPPSTPPSTRTGSPTHQSIVYSPAKEVEEYVELSDTSLAIQRDLHMEIAAMHAAIQKRLMLGGAFIILLIFLMIFY